MMTVVAKATTPRPRDDTRDAELGGGFLPVVVETALVVPKVFDKQPGGLRPS